MGKRRPNLTGRDVRCLADFVKKNRQALFGKAGNSVGKICKIQCRSIYENFQNITMISNLNKEIDYLIYFDLPSCNFSFNK